MKEEEIQRKFEIVRTYEDLSRDAKYLVDVLNAIWEEKENLRTEYQTLTGKDISEHYKPR